LDNHNHDELGITEPGFLVHYMNTETHLIYEVDEHELFVNDSDQNRHIVGLYIRERDEYKLFNEEEMEQIKGLTEVHLPRIQEIAYGTSPATE
jgi:hypothetical protein